MSEQQFTPLRFPTAADLASYTTRRSNYSRRAQYLLDQLEKRGPVPEDVWGPKPSRRAVAKIVQEIAAHIVDSPATNFIPDDPFIIVAFAFKLGEIDLDHIEDICLALERKFLFSEVDFMGLLGKTFGEVVDEMRGMPAHGSLSPLTESERTALRNAICPKLWLLLDLRKWLTSTFNLGKRDIRPDVPLMPFLSEDNRALSDLVAESDHLVELYFSERLGVRLRVREFKRSHASGFLGAFIVFLIFSLPALGFALWDHWEAALYFECMFGGAVVFAALLLAFGEWMHDTGIFCRHIYLPAESRVGDIITTLAAQLVPDDDTALRSAQ
ncbi:MAG: hypothetical protein KJ052_07535 [Candidatus Hydrogenedentes bacterium]|nr:hypothetical protein [Candidatus Hydrogenedentota bacterium]